MRTRIFWGGFALLPFLISIPFSISSYKDWKVYRGGSIVSTRLITVPKSSPGYIKFQFDGHTYSKRISGYLDPSIRTGDTLQLKFLRGYEGHFLFPDENPLSWDIVVILMMLFLGFACLYYAFRKNPPNKVFGRKIG